MIKPFSRMNRAESLEHTPVRIFIPLEPTSEQWAESGVDLSLLSAAETAIRHLVSQLDQPGMQEYCAGQIDFAVAMLTEVVDQLKAVE